MMHLKAELKYLSLLAVISYLYLFSVPAVNLPLNDDYAYLTQVNNLLEKGEIRLHPAAPAFSVLQTLYGALLGKLFGLSHALLSTSTLAIAGIVIVLTYFFLREFVDKEYAFLGSLTLLVNPIFYNLSHTFMTDVPTLVFVVPGITFLVKGLETWRLRHLLPAAFLLNIGFWNRQYSVLPLGAVILYPLYATVMGKRDYEIKSILVVTFVTAINVLVGLRTYFGIQDPYVCQYDFVVGATTLKNFVQSGFFISFFLFPLGVVFLFNIRSLLRELKVMGPFFRLSVVAFMAAMIALVVGRTFIGLGNKWLPRMPFEDSTTNVNGIGPVLIVGEKPHFFPYGLWLPVILLTLVTALGLLILILSKIKEKKYLRLSVILLFAVGPLSLFGGFFDRYYMIAVPMILPFFFARMSRGNVRMGLTLLLLSLGAWSWYGTYDYLSWNQARWSGIQFLIESGVPEEKIDGGMEYVARFFKGCGNPAVQGVRQTGWAASLSDDYLISFSEMPKYERLKEIPYYGPFGEKLGNIYVLREK